MAMLRNRDLLQRLDEVLKERGLSDRAASLKGGLSGDAIRGMRRYPDHQPKRSTVFALATALDVDPAYLLYETDERSGARAVRTASGGLARRRTAPSPAALPIRHRCGAGLWQELDDQAQDSIGEAPIGPHPGFAAFPQWTEQVIGDSMDLAFPDGSLVRVVDAIALGYLPRDGDRVVIVRRRGGAIERSVKEVAVSPGPRIAALPRSTNPRWQKPIVLADGLRDDDDEVWIAALVLDCLVPGRSD